MIWVYEHGNTNATAGWVGWSQELLRLTLLPSFRERKEEVTSLRYKSPRHFDIVDGSIIRARFEPIDWDRHFTFVSSLS